MLSHEQVEEFLEERRKQRRERRIRWVVLICLMLPASFALGYQPLISGGGISSAGAVTATGWTATATTTTTTLAAGVGGAGFSTDGGIRVTGPNFAGGGGVEATSYTKFGDSTTGFSFNGVAGVTNLFASNGLQMSWSTAGATTANTFTSTVASNSKAFEVAGFYNCTAASGNNCITAATNGARFDFGSGASDYASSDGTTVTFAGALATATGMTVSAAGANNLTLSGSGPEIRFNGGNQANLQTNTADSVTSSTVAAFVLYESVAITAGDLLFAVQDSVNNNRLSVSVEGNTAAQGTMSATSYTGTGTTGTPASGTGITANATSQIKTWVHKVTVINTALTAAATSDVTLHVTPVNTRIVRVVADVTQVFTGGALSAMTVMCGNAAGGNQYLLANSVFTAQNTWGDVVAEMGAGVVSATLADFGTVAAGVPGAITVQCRFTCTGANCNAATQGSVTFYVEGVTYP